MVRSVFDELLNSHFKHLHLWSFTDGKQMCSSTCLKACKRECFLLLCTPAPCFFFNGNNFMLLLATIQGSQSLICLHSLKWKNCLVLWEMHCCVMDMYGTRSVVYFLSSVTWKLGAQGGVLTWSGSAGSQVRKTRQLSSPLRNRSQWRETPLPLQWDVYDYRDHDKGPNA